MAKPPITIIVALIVTLETLKPLDHNFGCHALRMINLDAPQVALQGDTIKLICSFTLAGELEDSLVARDEDHQETGPSRHEDAAHRGIQTRALDKSQPHPSEQLYAIKWYKDEREFFRFVAMAWPNKQALPIEGLNIDVEKSDNQTVVLRDVSLRTSGSFRCEVSTDAPSFVTKAIERKVLIYSLPSGGPVIEFGGGRASSGPSVHLGDQMEFSCLSQESKPSTQLDWIINETWNLTARLPRAPDGTTLFTVTKRRLARLPKLTADGDNPQDGRTKYQTVIASVKSRTSHINYATYELDHKNGRPLARSLDGQSTIQALSPSVLDQLLEVSMTRLNLTVDTNLFQYLQEAALKQNHKPPSGSSSSTGRKSTAKANQTTSPGTHFTTRKSNLSPVPRRSMSAQEPHESSLTLRVRCVARVMHLSMSDEVRLRLVNGRKDETPRRESAQIESIGQEQKRTRVNNSSGSLSPQDLWACLATHITWLLVIAMA